VEDRAYFAGRAGPRRGRRTARRRLRVLIGIGSIVTILVVAVVVLLLLKDSHSK
jgi:hypothetical protein